MACNEIIFSKVPVLLQMTYRSFCVMLTVSDKVTNNNPYERSGKICGQIQVKIEPDCGDSEPQMNAEGVLEIKPRTNENMDFQKGKTLANGMLELGTKIKTEPGIEFQDDQPDNFSQCPLHGESGTQYVEQMADCSADNQFQPITIAPQQKSSDIPTVCELQESCIPVESCQTILYDSVLGPTTVKVDILPNDTPIPQQQQEQIKSPHKQKQVWPKYTAQRSGDSSRRQHNQKRKSNDARLLTYYGHKVKPCSVKLKRLKLTVEIVGQLYTMHQKAKQEKYSKLKKQRSSFRKRGLVYECSSSEDDDCDNSPSSGLSTEIKESGKIVPVKCSRNVKKLSDMGSDASTVPAVESKQSTEGDSSYEDVNKSETDNDEDGESADPNFIPEAISGDDTEEANSSNCSESELDDDAGNLGLISKIKNLAVSKITQHAIAKGGCQQEGLSVSLL